MAAPAITIEANFGGRIGQKFIDSGAAAIWPFDDVDGSAARELVADRDGVTTVSRGDFGSLPEYGSSFGFNGVSHYVSVAHAAAFAPSNAMAFGFLLLVGAAPGAGVVYSIMRKENGGTSGRQAVQLFESGGSYVLRFSLNIGGTLRDLDYTIPSIADWISTPRYILCRYTGSDMQIVQMTLAGVVTTLATAAYSGAVGNGTPSAIFIGSHDGTDQFYQGLLQWVVWYTDDHPNNTEMLDIGTSVAWTNLIDDVRTADGIDAEWGIRHAGPSARVATVGTLQFSLGNATNNSAGLLGYYSLDHANSRPGFGFLNPVRLTIEDPSNGARYVKFIGTLSGIHPEPGQRRVRATRCTVVDYMDELARATLPAIPLVEATLSGPAFGKLIQALPVHPHDIAGIDPSAGTVEVFPYGLDTSRDERDTMINEATRIANSELGFIYVRGNEDSGGVLTIDGRQARASSIVPQWTISDADISEMEAERERQDVLTRVEITRYPREEDSGVSVLYALNVGTTQPAIRAGESITLRALYADAANDGERVGGTDFVTPVATTDYTANSSPTGSGDDMTANLTASVAFGANSAEVTLTNGSIELLYVTKLQLRGVKVMSYDPVVAVWRASDEARTKYGDNVLTLDQPYQADIASGYDAAAYLGAAWGRERTIVRSVTLKPITIEAGSALTTMAIAADIGDLVELSEVVTGLASAQYFIQGVHLRIDAGPILRTTWYLAPRELSMWALGEAGFSELGETTVAGY